MSEESLLSYTEKELLHKPDYVPISFTIIVKDNPDGLRDALRSIKAIAHDDDQIIVLDTGSRNNATIKAAREFTDDVISRPLVKQVSKLVKRWLPEYYGVFRESEYADGMIMDFAAARQYITDAAANDWIFWIDSDDTIIDPDGNLRDLLNRLILSGKRDSLMMDYHYSFNEHGAVTTVLKRERLFDRTKYYWKGRCHETAIPREGVAVSGAALFTDLRAVVAHTNKRRDGAHKLSDIRNYVILRAEIEECRKKDRAPDPRSIYYLANAARGLKRDTEAIDNYKVLIDRSGSRDDRFAAAYSIGVAYLENKRVPEAMDWFRRCQSLNTADPRSYYMLARSCYLLGRYQEAAFHFQVGRMLPEPRLSLHTYDPTHIHIKPLHIAILTYKELDDFDACAALMDELRQKAPHDRETQDLEATLSNWAAGRRITDAAQTVLANLRDMDTQLKYNKIRSLLGDLNAVPEQLENRGLAALEPPDNREIPKRDVVFFCGNTAEPWGPENAKTGIGGSERMVIEMAPRLQRLGFRVSVYANVPHSQRGLDKETGVNWQHFGSFDYRRKRGVVIFWRSVRAVELPVPCERRIVWCHDVQSPHEWTPARIALLDQAWFLSDYHANTIGEAARTQLERAGKLLITRNGVDTALFEKQGIGRDPRRIVFLSSPDRGALTAIKIFRDAKHRSPGTMKGTELHIYYGFTKTFMERAAAVEYLHVPDVDRDINSYEYMKAVFAAVDACPDVHFHGRVSFEEAARALCSAGVWLYPTRFPEISCMGAMEAQVAGCNIVATPYAALKETINWDVRAWPIRDLSQAQECADTLTKAVSEYAMPGIDKRAAERFSMDKLADEWSVELMK